MRLPLAGIILLTLCVPQNIFPQEYYSAFNFFAASNYAEAPLQKGLPEIEPGKVYPIKLKNPSFAWINPVYGLEQIFFIKGYDSGNREKYLILTVSPSDGYSLNPMVILKRSGNELYGYSSITVTLQSTFSFPLKLNISKSGNEIKYSWPSDLNPGGNIEPLPIIKIGGKLNSASLPFKYNNIKPADIKNKTILLIWRPDSSIAGERSFSDFNNLYKKYGKNPNLVFISVGADKSYSGNRGNYFNWKPDSITASLLGEYYPLTLIADTSGTIIYSRLGYKKSDLDYIKKILNSYKQNRP